MHKSDAFLGWILAPTHPSSLVGAKAGNQAKNNISEIATIKLAIKRIDILVTCNSLEDSAIQNIKRRNIFASCFMHKSDAFLGWILAPTHPSSLVGAKAGNQAKNNISEIATIKLAIKRIDILVICNSLEDGAIQNIKRRNIFASCFMHKSDAFLGWILAPTHPSSLVGAKAGNQAKNNISEIATIKLAIKRIDILVICNSLEDGAIQNIKRRNIFASCFMHKSDAFLGWILAPTHPSSLVGAKAGNQAKNNISEIATIKLAIKRIDILVICNSLEDSAIQNIKRRNIFATCFMHKSDAFLGWILAPTHSSSLVGAKAGNQAKNNISEIATIKLAIKRIDILARTHPSSLVGAKAGNQAKNNISEIATIRLAI